MTLKTKAAKAAFAVFAAAAILAVGFGTKQVYDAAIVQEAAELFARGNYKMMSADYLNAYPYQLGICLPMELLLRLFPGLNLNLTMQLVNVAMALGAAAAMAAALPTSAWHPPSAPATQALVVRLRPMVAAQ